MDLKKAFGAGLRQIRVSRGLSQEDFSEVSSRTYMSSLERGLKSPTVEKLDMLAGVLGVSPVSILAASALEADEDLTLEALFVRIRSDLGEEGEEG